MTRRDPGHGSARLLLVQSPGIRYIINSGMVEHAADPLWEYCLCCGEITYPRACYRL